MTDEQITQYASYGGLIVQHPRANVDLSWQIKQAFEMERARIEQEIMLVNAGYQLQANGTYIHKTDWLVVLAPVLYPLVAFMTFFGLMFLKIWLIR